MPKLIVKSGSQAGREIELKDGLNRLGRNPANDIHLEEASISSFHCEFSVAEIAVAIRDLNSTNGSFINGQPISKSILQTGDRLVLGEIEFAVELPQIIIALPELRAEEAPSAAFLDDGTPACFNHHELCATFRCSKCENWWCDQCVRQMKRLNGGFLQFCPECDAPCNAIPKEVAAKKFSFLGRLGETLRITRKK